MVVYRQIVMLLISACTFLTTWQLGAQINVQHLEIGEGIIDTRVQCVYQDQTGFIWIGTPYGLYRYDGSQVKSYRYDPHLPNSNFPSSAWSITEDRHGNLYIPDRWHQAIIKYDQGKDVFSFVFEGEEIGSVYADKSDHLWIAAGRDGLIRFSLLDNSIVPLPFDQSKIPKNTIIWEFIEDKKGQLWFSSRKGLYLYSKDQDSLQFFKNEVFGSQSINDLFVDGDGSLWIATEGGLFKSNLQSNKYLFHSVNPQIFSRFIQHIEAGHDGNLWIGAGIDGIFIYNPRDNKIKKHIKKSVPPNSRDIDILTSLYADRSGGMWITTANNGLFYWSPYLKNFQKYNTAVRSESWILFDRHDRKIWITAEADPILRSIDDFSTSLVKDRSASFLATRDTHGRIWSGAWRRGITRYDPTRGEVVHFRKNSSDSLSLPHNDAVEIYCDTRGDVWVSMYGFGLYRYDANQNCFVHHKIATYDNLFIDKIIEDSLENLWLGTNEGLVKLGPNREFELSYDSAAVFEIYIDRKEIFWLGTSAGLYRFNPETLETKKWNHTDGLIENKVVSILQDHHGDLWLGTIRGLSRFNIEDQMFTNYDATDGLPLSAQFIRGRSFKSPSGRLYFGQISGIVSFNPDDLGTNPEPPQVVITDIQIGNMSLPVAGTHLTISPDLPRLQQSSVFTERITLKHDQNDISFAFSALNYVQPEKNRYEFRLVDHDQTWKNSHVHPPMAFYTNLDPGKYRFEVRGINNDGIRNEEPSEINLFIAAPWWATWWAYLCYGAIFSLVLLLIRRFEITQQRLRYNLELERVKAEQLDKLNQAKSQFFADISHEFRTPLTLINGSLQELFGRARKNDVQPLNLIKRNTRRLLDLINQILDLAKIESSELSLKVSQGDIVKHLRELFAVYRSEATVKNVAYSFKSNKSSLMMYCDWEKLDTVILNLLANAFNSTPENGQISLELEAPLHGQQADAVDHGSVEIKVIDDGPGINSEDVPFIFDRFFQSKSLNVPSRRGTGIGLALVKEIVSLHHGEVCLESDPETGSSFILTLPIGKEHFMDDEMSQSEYEPDLKIMSQGDVTYYHPTESGHINRQNLPTVLLVDDDPEMRAYVRKVLGHRYQLTEVANGKVGLEYALREVPDLIVSDVLMPEMHGLEFCDRIKSDVRTSHIPMILLTAMAGSEERIEGLRKGADAYIPKPFDHEELIVRIEKLLQSRKQVQDHFRKFTPASNAQESQSIDEKFLDDLFKNVNENLSDANFSALDLQRALGISRPQLYRKVKALTGQSVHQLINDRRMHKASQLLKGTQLNITEIAYDVGFKDPAYFSRVFKKVVGMAPSEYR